MKKNILAVVALVAVVYVVSDAGSILANVWPSEEASIGRTAEVPAEVGPISAAADSSKKNRSGKSPVVIPASLACGDNEELDVEALVLATMEAVNSKLSKTRKVLLAKMLDRVADEEFDNDAMRAVWVAVLSRESRFNGSLTSPAGAVGLGQLIPKFAKDFGKTCGYDDVTEADLRDDHTNARLSACYLNGLVKLYLSSDQPKTRRMAVPLAWASYNAGQHSETINKLKNLTSINLESANYIAVLWTTMLIPQEVCREKHRS